MASIADMAPMIGYSKAGLILISYWSVASAAHQREAAKLAMDLWDNAEWPEGLLSHHVFGGHDGTTVINYAQWRDNQDFDNYIASDQPDRAHKIEDDPVGITRESIDRFSLYRRMEGTASGAEPGCFVLVTFDLESPARAEALVDTIIATAERTRPFSPENMGDITSHFHINQSKTQVVNVVEFVDAQSHEILVASSLQDDSPMIKAIAALEGAKAPTFQRFDLLAGRVASTVEGTNG